ncbi:MAG: 2-C-methyl-D-erythritol 4-phosphate cytidylyltransferase [Gracilibacteraceae bacterium]|jgi:2-C-methyl-D-erythritol 4-phosphate cytidylyltransferase|nr:2-C-methyl-D-erythritol 4-phosphate cytidylyltransferase [Gracilibacteraceae bacterium]
MNTAIILAAGRGTRMNAGRNKQYLILKNKPILAHSIGIFQKCNLIDEIIVVINQDEEANCRINVIEKYQFNKVKKLVPGGDERQHSVYNGLMHVNSECDIVLVHDGARPLVTHDVIERCINELRSCEAVSCGMPIKDTVKIIDENRNVRVTPMRDSVWITQTPQAFKLEILLKAHNHALEEKIICTDDAMLVEQLGINVRMVEGDYENIKITTPDDLIMAESILNYKRKFRK